MIGGLQQVCLSEGREPAQVYKGVGFRIDREQYHSVQIGHILMGPAIGHADGSGPPASDNV